ncbi:MAG: PH domain-containing protein [Acidimicrobiales bacterium]
MSDHPPPHQPPVNPLPLPPQALQAPGVAGDIDWKRPHPYTLLIEFVSSVRDLIFPIVIVLSQGGSGGAMATEIIPALAILAPVGFAVARYYSTRYALTDDALLHNYGVISKNRQVLPRRNIQNLSTSAGLIARATGLMELTVSDASQGGDVNLRLLSAEDAEELMTLLRREAHGPAANASSPVLDSAVPQMAAPSGTSAYVADPIHSLDLVDLVKLRAVTSAGPLLGLFALVVLAAVVLSFPDATRDVTDELSWGGIIFILAPMAAGFLAAVAPVLALGGFRLWSDPDRLRIKTGLLTEVQLNARRERLQLVEVNRHIAAQRLGLEAIRFETADVEGGNAAVNYLAPAVAKDSWPRFAADALGDVELGEADLARVSPLTKRRSRVRFAMGAVPFIVALTVLIVVASGGNRTILAVGFVVLIVAYVSFALWYSRRRAERLGWAVGPEQFLFRTGVIGERLILVRKDKLQILRLDQTFFQRRLGLASVQVGTAGMGLRGVVSLPDLELDTAFQLLKHLAKASATTPLAQTL